MGAKAAVVGLQPWLPWPLNRWRWWIVPVRAERLAALRIGLALCLLIDLLLTYVPACTSLFGADSLGAPPTHEWNFTAPSWRWSLLHNETRPAVLQAAMVLWTFCTFFLLIGFCTRLN